MCQPDLDLNLPPAAQSDLRRYSLSTVPTTLIITLVRGYQICISPLIGRHCRFHPSCSQYCILAVQKYGILSGLWRSTNRICRCHPWNSGGHDPP